MRHTCVSLLLAEGAPPHVVQQIVGHSAIDVTMTIYAHASLDEKRTALQRLVSVLHEAVAVGNGGQTAWAIRNRRPGTWPDLRFLLVGRGGVEPPTFHFSGGRSYQLSYLPHSRCGNAV
jgi:hypothetical protein